MAYYLLSLTNCYFIIADEVGSGICGWALSIIAAVSVVPAVQVRTFHYLAPMATVGLVGMIVMVIIVIVSLAVYPVAPPADSVSDLWPSSELSFLQLYSNVSNIIFAFQGQSMFFELMAEMRDPLEFNKTLIASNAINTTTYVITAVVGFHLAGRSVDPFVLNSVAPGPLRIVATCCLALHLLLAYVLCGQPLHIVIHEIVSPGTAHSPTWTGQLRHFGITSVVLVGTFVIGNVIPFFKDLQGIIASACAAPIIFFFPAWFLWRSAVAVGDVVAQQDKLFIAVCLLIFLPITFGLGLTTAFQGIISAWDEHGGIFQCARPPSSGH